MGVSGEGAGRRVGIDWNRVAPYYDLHVVADYDLAWWRRRAAGVARVCELMCGTGRLLVPLAAAGTAMTGVDRSGALLTACRCKLEERGLVADLHEQDVTALDLGPARFDLVFCGFQSFGEILGRDARVAALRLAAAHLAPGGTLAITLHEPAVRRRGLDGQERVHETASGLRVVSRFVESSPGRATGEQRYEELVAGRQVERARLQLAFDLVEADAFRAEVAEAGLRVVELRGDYDDRPWERGRSPYQLWSLHR